LSVPLQDVYEAGVPGESRLPWYAPDGIVFFSPDSLWESQVGYRYTASGELAPAWRPSWVVIASVGGDAVIADQATPGSQVLYASHGTGAWRPEPFAPDLESFFRALAVWLEVSKGKPEILYDEDEGRLFGSAKDSLRAALVPLLRQEDVPIWLGRHWLLE
jgi:hypothetical protein